MTAAEAKQKTETSITEYNSKTQELFADALTSIYLDIAEACRKRLTFISVIDCPSEGQRRIILLLESKGYVIRRVPSTTGRGQLRIAWES